MIYHLETSRTRNNVHAFSHELKIIHFLQEQVIRPSCKKPTYLKASTPTQNFIQFYSIYAFYSILDCTIVAGIH